MKYCPKCKFHPSYSKAVFCVLDGEKLVDLLRCDCGEELSDVEKFCPICGKEKAVIPNAI